MNARRCAIYTRKSSEEGLEQEFNSLAAQRESCEAYIKSQEHEGWIVVRKRYDDGGYSGGNLDRPALKELLQDIESGSVDTIVVYKVDRLTRSLSDFARIVEVLDRKKASFVAVTQHFNTTTSMGRLTLNVLLSFAQFEREVTGERIRDKIAASKRKGMWMGGVPPLGYEVKDRKLLVIESEAERVRHIFERYLAHGSVSALRNELRAKGIRGKSWTSVRGTRHGGAHFSHGALYRILQNRTYRGEVAYNGAIYAGEHPAIVGMELWDQVQKRLGNNRRRESSSTSDPARPTYLLEGLLYDDIGNLMSPSYALKKDGRRYRYYVSTALTRKDRCQAGSLARIPMDAIEQFIKDRLGLVDDIGAREATLKKLVKITLSKDSLELHFSAEVSESEARRCSRPGDEVFSQADGFIVRIKAQLRMRGGEKIVVGPNGESVSNDAKPNPVLIKNLLQAHRFRAAMRAGTYSDIQTLARHEECTERYIRKVLPMAYLAPDITDAILHGTQPPALELRHFISRKLPLQWDQQRRLLGFAS